MIPFLPIVMLCAVLGRMSVYATATTVTGVTSVIVVVFIAVVAVLWGRDMLREGLSDD